MRGTAVLVSTTAAFLLASCSPAPPPPVAPTKKCDIQTVSLVVVASPVINPTEEGEARPVQLRIYQLKDDVRLQSASFFDVWKKDAAVLGDDIIKRDEIFVYPSSRTDVKFDRDANAQHVVGAALFRNPKGKSWFVSFELPPAPGKGDCTVPGCEGDDCAKKLANPEFAMWIDATRVDDGADHKDDVSDGRRIRVVQLSKPGSAPAGSSPGGSAPAKGAQDSPPKAQAN
jgi:type VI secretion system protein VasD